MDHEAICQKLSAYLDGAVTPAEKLLIEKHLAECGECRKTLRELEKTVIQVRDLGAVEPPAWFTARVMARVREDAGRESGLLRRLVRMPLRWRIPLEAAALLFVTVTGYLVYRNVSSDMKQIVPLSGEIRHEALAPTPSEDSSRDTDAEPATAWKKPQPVRKKKHRESPVSSATSAGHSSSPPRQEAPLSPHFAGAPPKVEDKGIGELRMDGQERARSVAPSADSANLAREGKSPSGLLQSKSLDVKGIETLRLELSVDDPDSAEREAARETARHGGMVLRRDTEKNAERVIVVRMRRSLLDAYLERLEKLGKLSGTVSIPEGDEPIELRLTVKRKGM